MGGLKEKGGRARVEVWGSETLSLHVQNICAAEREREKKEKEKAIRSSLESIFGDTLLRGERR